MRRAAPIALALLLAACGGGGNARNTAPAPCSGPLKPMNARHWTPTPDELALMAELAKEACRT